MRVAFISLMLPPQVYGGVPQQVHLLATTLAQRGHDITVFSLYAGYPDAPYRVRQVAVPPAWQRRVDRLRGLGMHVFPWFVARERFEDFDIIHAHGDSHFVLGGRPVLRTIYSTGIDQALHAKTWRRRLGMLSLLPFELWSAHRADAVTYISRAQARLTPWVPGTIIPCGVDLSFFQPDGSRSSSPSILFVAGTMGGSKRGRLLVEAFEQVVRPALPDAELWMVCPERPSAPGIVAMGPVPSRRLRELYQGAWVFCLPSSWEGFGVPYIEAMASGTPVVATPNAGALEVLDRGRYGVVTSPERLGQTLVELLPDAQRRTAMGETGLRRAREFDLDRVSDGYEELYASLLRPHVVRSAIK